MTLKYDINIETQSIIINLKRLINQIYKLLPYREEGQDWELPLSTIMEEFSGMDNLLIGFHTPLFRILCKLEGLRSLSDEDKFLEYRRTIFESMNLVQEMSDSIEYKYN